MRFGVCVVLILVTSACTPTLPEPSFDSSEPTARAFAIQQAASAGDESAIPRIIEQLNSEDPLVRMVAIESLQRLTGENFGYHHYDPPTHRRAAVNRWIQAYQAGEIAMQPHVR